MRTVAIVGAVVTTTVVTVVVAAPKTASPAAPTITSFTPTEATVGSVVTIDGSDLSGATQVNFNFTVAAPIITDSATQITTSVPLGIDNGPITVSTPGGTTTSSSIFTLAGFYVLTTTLPDASPGVTYHDQLQTTGGTSPYRWTRTGALPAGITLTRTGLLAGNPSLKKAVAGTYSVTVNVRDSTRHHRQVASRTLSLTVS
ncbi:MAG TPA: hypothetical protein VN816_06255 [Acidimicrobiales bacterium]|nr:hypothetical protein [Acidimicrobiales bacterium]